MDMLIYILNSLGILQPLLAFFTVMLVINVVKSILNKS